MAYCQNPDFAQGCTGVGQSQAIENLGARAEIALFLEGWEPEIGSQ